MQDRPSRQDIETALADADNPEAEIDEDDPDKIPESCEKRVAKPVDDTKETPENHDPDAKDKDNLSSSSSSSSESSPSSKQPKSKSVAKAKASTKASTASTASASSRAKGKGKGKVDECKTSSTAGPSGKKRPVELDTSTLQALATVLFFSKSPEVDWVNRGTW